jgi:D-glycero-alpha-D-manno-heptose-7-phosphate kinase
MVITRTPFRISFFGGGTDFPQYYKKNDSCGVIAATINKYCYISIRELPNFFEHIHRISYSKIEHVKNIEEIQHPVIRTVLQLYRIQKGLEIHYDGDMPARSGLGSSSAFSVGMINAILEMLQKDKSKYTLADEALKVEQKILKEAVGSQDQIITSFGGLNHINFYRNDTYQIRPVQISDKEKNKLLDHLMLFYTGLQRYASNIESDKIKNIEKNKNHLHNISQIHDEAVKLFDQKKLNMFEIGNLLKDSWKQKKALSNKVSLPLIDEAYEAAIQNGAYGGKILGAGGGGFLLFIVPEHKKDPLREALKMFLEIEFSFENEGSKVIFNSDKVNE